MKKIKTTEKHPEMKAGIEFESTGETGYTSGNGYFIPNDTARHWIKSGLIVEVVEEREIVDVEFYSNADTITSLSFAHNRTLIFHTGQFTEAEIRDRLTRFVDGEKLLGMMGGKCEIDTDRDDPFFMDGRFMSASQVLEAFTKTPQPERFTEEDFQGFAEHSFDDNLPMTYGFDCVSRKWFFIPEGVTSNNPDDYKRVPFSEVLAKWRETK